MKKVKGNKETGLKIRTIGCPKVAIFELSELQPAVYNPRTMERVAFEGLKASIKKFSCVEPIVINIRSGKNKIIGGHQRYKALLEEGVEKCLCVTVDLAEQDEKLLNLSLNNPQIQGQFAEEIGEYIDELRAGLETNKDFISLRIAELKDEINGKKVGTINYTEEKLKPFKRTHILLSFSPEILADIHGNLAEIIKIKGVEYEQCSN